jgi:DNA-directed RNA polymerase specialized sigma24 family protein
VPPVPATDDELSDRFQPTHWSVILAAGQDGKPADLAQRALAQLCQTYWAPLYGFIRSRGYALHDAQDLTQGFFAHLHEHQIYTRADRQKGKFRSFLLASVKNFLLNERAREQALKRGGACEFLPLHEEQVVAAEALFKSTAVPGAMAVEDRLFDRQWAETLIRTAFQRLAAEFAAAGKAALFEALEGFLRTGARPLPTYDELAVRLAMPTATIRSHVTRLRARYREVLRAELRCTVDSEGEVDQELRELVRILTNG